MGHVLQHGTNGSIRVIAPVTSRAVQRACEYVLQNPTATHTGPSLARVAGLSLSEFQRQFRRVVGVTPRQFAEAERMKHFKEGLRRTGAVLPSAAESGIGSSRGVHERSLRHLGMTAQQYSTGARGLEMSYGGFDTPLGRVLLAATDRGLSFVHFGESERDLLAALHKEFPRAHLRPAAETTQALMKTWADALHAYLQGEAVLPQLPVHVRSTAFQQRVWAFLQTIPHGETRTYTEVAKGIGNERAVRAVASACAANNVAVLIPCHRVLRQGGALSGYRWGADRKRRLLELERKCPLQEGKRELVRVLDERVE